MSRNIYEYSVKNSLGEEVSLKKYEGKVLLIVNTASKCGLVGQMGDLTALYEEFGAGTADFEILAFPSNDFAGQEPLDSQGIVEFCSLEYRATFPIFEKIHVKGKEVHPLYQYLSKKSLNNHFNAKPLWNYQKYLVNHEGEVVDFFYPFRKPNAKAIKKAILKLLTEKKMAK